MASRKGSMADVLCVGILVADIVGQPIDAYPERGKLALVPRMELHSGGCAANTGIALGKLGVSTQIVGRVGRDGFGDFMVGELERHGLDANGVIRDPEANTSATMVLVHSDAERSFLHYLGANTRLTETDVAPEQLESVQLLHVAGSFLMPKLDGEPTARLLADARRRGLITCLDTCWDAQGRWMSVLAPCLPHLDHLVPSIEEARQITGQNEPGAIAGVLHDAGVGTVVLKMGEDGCYVSSQEGAFALPALSVDAVDALGAGDAFAAGYIAGLVQEWDLERTARLATAVGATCVTALGATTGIRSLPETLRFMSEKTEKLGATR
jgi:sugar/nucleoside kinase (ribokinase family)